MPKQIIVFFLFFKCFLTTENGDNHLVHSQNYPNNPYCQKPVALQISKESLENQALAILNEDFYKKKGLRFLKKTI